MLAEALDGAQALAEDEDLAGLEERHSLVESTADTEGEHTAEAAGLLLGDGVTGMGGQP